MQASSTAWQEKKRSERKELSIGTDDEGLDLPEDDDSPYIAAQIYVVKKHAANNSEFATELQYAKASGKLEYRKIANGKIANTCSFANIMVPCLSWEHGRPEHPAHADEGCNKSFAWETVDVLGSCMGRCATTWYI